MTLPFPLPPRAPGGPQPVWTGAGFSVGGESFGVLEYSTDTSGWDDELTGVIEETTGPDHYLDRASRAVALREVAARLPAGSPVILEVGCSSGYLLRQLRAAFPGALVMGADVVREPLERLAAALPGVPLFRFDLARCPLPDACADAVVLLNVLEHIEDDAAALAQVRRILKPGGAAVIEVPAGPGLHDAFDRAVRHFRRYRLADLERLARSAGLEPVRGSHLGFLIYPAFWLVKRLRARRPPAESGIVASSVRLSGGGRLPDALMRLELALGRRVSYPAGIRCLLTCVRPAGARPGGVQ